MEKKKITDENGNMQFVKMFISYGDDRCYFAVLEDGKLLIKRGSFYSDTGERIRENNND